MFPAATLLTTLLLAISIAASLVEVRNTHITLPFAKRINASGGTINLLQHDQARAAALREYGTAIQSDKSDRRAVISTPATNKAVSYVASVGVGCPPTQYDLIIDTGSSNTWVGARQPYVRTGSSTQTSDTVTVSYGSGSFSGTEYLDTVTLSDGLVIKRQSIGAASQSTGFTGVDGILGIGPVDLTVGTLSPDSSTAIPTVTDNLFSQGTISEHVIGVSFEPITSSSGEEVNGELTFGGTDSSKYTGRITYVPITSTSPASTFWGIDQSITYGHDTPILPSTAGIVDTGTSLILLATEAYNAYQKATGGTLDAATSLLSLSPSQYKNLKSLFFHIGDSKFELTANGQIWPRALNTAIGGTSGSIYSIVSNANTPLGQGLDFLNGQTFLERFYSVYDTKNKRVGLATTPYTTATSN